MSEAGEFSELMFTQVLAKIRPDNRIPRYKSSTLTNTYRHCVRPVTFLLLLVVLQHDNDGFSQFVSVHGKARLAGNGRSLAKRRNAVRGR